MEVFAADVECGLAVWRGDADDDGGLGDGDKADAVVEFECVWAEFCGAF